LSYGAYGATIVDTPAASHIERLSGGVRKSGYVVDNIFAGNNLRGQSLLAVGMFE
jgi:hypothetical protein